MPTFVLCRTHFCGCRAIASRRASGHGGCGRGGRYGGRARWHGSNARWGNTGRRYFACGRRNRRSGRIRRHQIVQWRAGRRRCRRGRWGGRGCARRRAWRVGGREVELIRLIGRTHLHRLTADQEFAGLRLHPPRSSLRHGRWCCSGCRGRRRRRWQWFSRGGLRGRLFSARRRRMRRPFLLSHLPVRRMLSSERGVLPGFRLELPPGGGCLGFAFGSGL